ncbi:Ig-like domain-containing protein [Petroclostridium sp. X23]|uniref:Ig-like domain-containing protein n=1 Tax=Petroclostridium sp. X23 TaxID=3045146 RepID=UPI0024AD0D59|nr:Ig-like domain-containing protein [Petroclostridium sp. X23]WHH57774.1 Ig-like domain-containing protein [Petroclostridium sp. X23]
MVKKEKSNVWKFLCFISQAIRRKQLKPRLLRNGALMMAVVMLAGMLCITGSVRVSAVCGSTGIPSDTLTIKVGYFGGPYYTKKVYTLNDFDKLPQVEQAYTFIDNMPAICIDAAKGVRLSDLMEDAGIDVNSIQKFYFYATDIKQGWYECFDKADLLDTPRYYYPNLASHWDYDTQSALPEAEEGAVRVDTIMAYKDNWQRYADEPDFSTYDTSTRFRLLLGQVDLVEHNAATSAKWVHSIEVMLGGMPPTKVTLDQNIVDIKVGSTFQLKAAVYPDKATDKGVNWSSSDPAVATVDENGLVTVVGPGTAVITASTVVGNITSTCVVNGGSQGAEADGTAAAGTTEQKAEITDISAGAKEQKEETPDASAETKEQEEIPDTSAEKNEQNNQQYLVEKEAADTKKTENSVEEANVLGVSTSVEEAASQPWRVLEMSPDAVPLQQKKQKGLDVYTVLIFAVLFLSGALKKYSEYKKYLKGKL